MSISCSQIKSPKYAEKILNEKYCVQVLSERHHFRLELFLFEHIITREHFGRDSLAILLHG